MTGEAEIKIPYEDLTKVTIVCTRCGAEITANLTERKQSRLYPAGLERGAVIAPIDCVLCGEPLAPGLITALTSLRAWHDGIRACGYKAFFRIKAPTEGGR